MDAKLHLVTGPPGPGVTAKLLTEYVTRARAVGTCLWLAPSARAADAARQTIASAGMILCPNVFTFRGFAEAVLPGARSGSMSTPHADDSWPRSRVTDPAGTASRFSDALSRLAGFSMGPTGCSRNWKTSASRRSNSPARRTARGRPSSAPVPNCSRSSSGAPGRPGAQSTRRPLRSGRIAAPLRGGAPRVRGRLRSIQPG